MKHLFTPGPVPVPLSVVEACAQPVLYHRSNEFRELSQRVWNGLQEIFVTTDPVLVLAGSGMTGIEACIASTVCPGDRVLVLHHGRFGERLVTINQRYGAHVIELGVSWGEEITAVMVEDRLSGIGNITTVWLVHSETSTGVTLPLSEITSVIQRMAPDALIMVDAVLSVAIEPVLTEEWNLDAVVSGVQKGLMCPPGLAAVAVSKRMIDRIHSVPTRSYTLDLATVLKDYERGLFTWTPPVSLIAGLDVALGMILKKGLPATWADHQERASHVRSLARSRRFSEFGAGTSCGVVVLQHNAIQSVIDELATQHNIIVSGGQDQLKGLIMRIGICGSYTSEMMNTLFLAIDAILSTKNPTAPL
ncbi:MAG TPA: aminotransferase class V-fold PLP-dependent enzyme [Candidatus Didemnitutus sp.]|nr:aminotransferase class V-fold PLP-dependent enzyme [Candidatus Didemnitutus sp.]